MSRVTAIGVTFALIFAALMAWTSASTRPALRGGATAIDAGSATTTAQVSASPQSAVNDSAAATREPGDQSPSTKRYGQGHGRARGTTRDRSAAPRASERKKAEGSHSIPFVDTTEHASTRQSSAPNEDATKQAVLAYGQLSAAFEPNQGQADPHVKFLTRGRGFSLFLTADGAVLSVSKSVTDPLAGSPAKLPTSRASDHDVDHLAMQLDGANDDAQAEGLNQLSAKTNYFIGKDPKNWHTAVPTYGDVKYANVYSGVDLVYHGNQKELEYDFFVAARADASLIHLKLDGHALKIDGHGDLIVSTSVGEMRFRKPAIYQAANSPSQNSKTKDASPRSAVDGEYVLLASNEVGFKLGPYDHSRTLVIDPVLVYSTFVGGTQHDEARAIAVDSTGAAYITGWTSSSDFPVSAGAYDGTFTGGGNNNSDIFVTKLNPGGASIAYSTYIGGSEDDIANAIAIDSSGNAYVTGETDSPNFPTVSAYQESCSSTCSTGLADAYFFELGPDGSSLVYSTYFGGNGIDRGFGVALDPSNHAYIYGQTIADGQTENFPTTTGAYQTVYGGGNSDAFVAEFNTATSGSASLIYSTYLGGSGDEDYNGASDFTRKGGITVDSSGDAWVTGFTTGSFPTTSGAYQTTFQGGGSVTHSDAFVTELNPAGTALLYSTYFGGSGDDLGFGITIDSSSNVYVTGSTSSTNLPVTANAFQAACPSACATNFNGFLAVISPTAGVPPLHYSTYIAGANNGTSIQNGGLSVAIDSSLNAYVTGGTSATNFPTQGPIQASSGAGNDVFVTELATTGEGSPLPAFFSTYLGGAGDDFGEGIALDSSGNIYVAGYTNSTGTGYFPTTPGAYETGCGNLGQCNGKTDAFVAEINTANFMLTATVSGSGNITSSPAGINCPTASCSADFATSAVVTVTATPNSGETFTGWTGACSGTGACSVTLNSNQTVGATFGAAFLLNVGEAGTGTGTVVDNTTVISCQPNCSANYASGTVVTLTATPASNSTFTGWSGACTGTGNCVVTISAAETVTANFALTAAAAASCPTTGTDNWIGGASGNWSNASNWSAGVPNSASTNVCINNGSAAAQVTVDIDTQTIGTLFLGSNASLSISNDLQFTVTGNITNAGLITIASAGNGTWLNIGGTVTLTGGGAITMANGNALLRESSGGFSLTNVNNTISGAGDIGNNGLTFINQAAGIVNANSNSGNLNLDAINAANQGLIEATAGGHFQTNVTINNAGGAFAPATGSIVEFDAGSDIQGGTLNGTNGTLEAVGNTPQIDGSTRGVLTITGTFSITNDNQANFLGTINNTGSIVISAAGNSTWMNIVGTVMLTGGGTVNMLNSNALLREPTGGNTLINVNNTIFGAGDIGNNGLSFTNQAAGVVNANSSGNTLSIDAINVVNKGLFEASGAGVLQISVPVVNASATIIAQNSSTVNFVPGSVIQGGTINTATSGVMQGVSSTPVLDGSTQGPLTNAGNFSIANDGQTDFEGTIVNTGSITIASAGNGTWMNIVGATTLTGGGTVIMANGNALIRQPNGGNSLTNVNNVISGAGDIGNNGLAFINQAGGVVNANLASQTLSIDAPNSINRGVWEATNTGTLQISITVNNAAASITAGANSTVNLEPGGVIQGGTISTGSGALFQGVSGTPVLDGLTQGPLNNVGTFTIANDGQTDFEGTINNTGSILIASAGNSTWMNIVGSVTLTGAGTVIMNNGNALIREPNGGNLLTNINNVISGAGDIGNNGLSFTNQAAGIVNSNISGSTLNIDAANAANKGLLEATSGGALQVNTTINNAAATIFAGAGSTVNFVAGAVIQGGTLNTAAGTSPGLMQGVGSTPVIDGSTFGTLTNAGAFLIQNSGQTQFQGTINNTGSITIASAGNGTWMNIVGTVNLTGGGTVTMANVNALIREPNGGNTLVNVNNTISGAGDIGNNGLAVTNQGTINANDPNAGQLQLDPSGTYTNQGLTESTGVGVLRVASPISSSGVFFPAGSPAPGTITDASTYTQVAGGSYDVAIGGLNAGSQYSVMNVSGTASLAGVLNVTLANGFTPASGSTFTILNAASITGQFVSINAPALSGGLGWSVSYVPAAAPTSVVLTVGTGTSSSTLTVTEFGTGTGTVTDPAGAINCGEANGVPDAGNNCSATYTSNPPPTVTLTAMPGGSPASTFGGWGGACASSGTSPMCMVTVSGATTVTANFLPPPQSQMVTFTPGPNVTQTAPYDCPGNPNPITPSNPCTAAQGPNAHALELNVPQVYTPFTMVVTATEFQDNGLCPPGGSVTDPTNFSCRFSTFFNYGTDSSGNTLAPLCNPYANGNCVHYDVYYCVPQTSGACVPTPGQEPPPADYLNVVNWRISWNNDSFVPPSPTYTGSTARLYDDPDYSFTGTSPYGTICGQPEVSGDGSTQEPYSCQFEFDITSYFDPTQPVDATIGGTIRQFNDMVVAFPPTAPGTGSAVPPPTPAAPTLSGACVTGCAATANNVAFNSGTGGAFQLTPTGYPAPTISESGALPAGLTFSTATGFLSGTPVVGTGGTYPITITATNSAGTATENLVITIDQAPAITSSNSTTFTAGTMGSFQVTATGFPTPTFSETGALPSGVTFSTAGLLSGTPAAGTQGSYPITITATNGIGTTAMQSFTLTVAQGSSAPVFTSAASTTFTVGTAGTFNVTASGSPAPTFSETGALPSGVTLTTAGLLSGTPAAGSGGTYSITIKATNSVSSAMQSFTLTVDQAAAITSTNATSFTVGTMGSFQATATGYPAPTFTETGALPSGVTLTTVGLLSGTPAAGTQGSYPITIKATNGIGSGASQSFTLTVTQGSQPPVFTSAASTTFTVGTAGTFNVTASGSPAPTFTETGALPSGVTLTTAGLLSGTPAAGTGGSYPITIKATNTVSSVTQSFTLTVDQAPAITTTNATTFTVGAMGSFQVTATGYPAPTFTETAALPGGVTLTTTGLLSGTPAAGTQGSYPINIKATNGIGSGASQSFTLTVNAATTSSALNISPTSANFGNVYLGTAAERTVTLTNTGKTSISISKVAVTSGIQPQISISSSDNFTAFSLCPRTLNPGRSCVVLVTFLAQGTSTDTQTAALTITDTAAGSPQTVPLSATIINPQAKLNAGAISFPAQKVGSTSAAKSVTLTNTGTTNLTISSVSASGNFALAAPGSTCVASGTVAPKSSCVISVTFTPASRGIRTGSLTIKDNTITSPQFVVLTGIGD